MDGTAPKDAADAIAAAHRRIEVQFSLPMHLVHVLAAAHDHLSRALRHLGSDEANHAMECCAEALQACSEAEAKATARQRNQLHLVKEHIEHAVRMIFRQKQRAR
jgi:hypothetical protein